MHDSKKGLFMDSIITTEDEESLKRIRWTTIDIAVTACGPTTEATFSTSGNTVTVGVNPDKMTYDGRKLETHAILLKRLLKPMYQFALRELSSLDRYSNACSPFPTADKFIFVDLSDRTMWQAIDMPKPLNDFYKDLVDAEMQKDKFVGYVVDTLPSTGLVPLMELKASLVEWWCN